MQIALALLFVGLMAPVHSTPPPFNLGDVWMEHSVCDGDRFLSGGLQNLKAESRDIWWDDTPELPRHSRIILRVTNFTTESVEFQSYFWRSPRGVHETGQNFVAAIGRTSELPFVGNRAQPLVLRVKLWGPRGLPKYFEGVACKSG
jgi:hypothetical protein